MNFDDFYWHDAVIKNILINRSNPGNNDTITFEIEWPENRGKAKIIFEDVYWANMNLNFGVVAEETILDASVSEEDEHDLLKLRTRWKGMLTEVKLRSYKFYLNSTAGEIKIIAVRFKVDK